MSIKLLSSLIANQIAAGEVVERPVSVVKEMAENSLDAKASKIRIDIVNGGRTLIKINDDGCGIPKEELELALTRYATSKISSIDDLDNIVSFGFRGEALASITAVSRLTLISKTESQEHAWQIHAEGTLDSPEIKPSAYPNGTTIMVEDLFFNTPARRRFLKSDKTEFSHIQELVARLSLANQEIAFVLTHNDKIVYNLPKAVTPEQKLKRLNQILGRNFTEKMLPVSEYRENISIEGYVLPAPDETDTTPEVQYMYLNGRIVKEKNIYHAVKQAFTEVYAKEVKTNFVLFITINPQEVDVNVHPTKHEVRFQEPRFVHDFTVLSVVNALSSVCGTRLKTESEHCYAGSEQPESAAGINGQSYSDGGAAEEDEQRADSSFLINGDVNSAEQCGSGGCRDGRSFGGWASSRGNSYDHAREKTDRRQFEAYNSWVTGACGAENRNHPDQTGVNRINGTGESAEPVSLFGIFEHFACIGYDQRLYKVDLQKIDAAIMKDSLNEENVQSSLLMLPVEIDLEPDIICGIEEHADFLKTRGFTMVVRGKGRRSLQVIGVPSVIRRFNLSSVLHELFNTECWYESQESYNRALTDAVLKTKKYTLVETVQILNGRPISDFISDPAVAQIIDVTSLLSGKI